MRAAAAGSAACFRPRIWARELLRKSLQGATLTSRTEVVSVVLSSTCGTLDTLDERHLKEGEGRERRERESEGERGPQGEGERKEEKKKRNKKSR